MRISICLFFIAATILLVPGSGSVLGQEDAPSTPAVEHIDTPDAPGDYDSSVPSAGVTREAPAGSSKRWSKRTSVNMSLPLAAVIVGTIGVLAVLAAVLARTIRKPWLSFALLCTAVVWISAVSALHGFLNERAVERAQSTFGKDRLLFETVISEPYITAEGFGSREADDFVARLYKGGTVLLTERDMKTIAAGWGWRMLFWGVIRGDEHGWVNDTLLHTDTHHNIWGAMLDFTNPPAGAIGIYLVLLAAGAHMLRRRPKDELALMPSEPLTL